MSTPASDPSRSPRLVLAFAVLTALGVAAAAAVILIVVRHADAATAHDAASDRARLAARSVLAPELQRSDLVSRPSRERTRQLDRLVWTRVLIEGLRGATIYSQDGSPLYSAMHEPVDASTRSHVREALTGRTVSEIATAADGSRVLRTYVPIAWSRDDIAGVVRLDQEYGPIAAAVRRSSLVIAGVLEGLLVVLFLALVPALARASARIHAHIADLDRVATHDELTGMLNRTGFRREAGKRLVEQKPAALLLVDLDGLSEISGWLGPASAERLLVEAAGRLRRALGHEHAVLARFGDDAFGVLCAADNDTDAEQVARRIGQAFSSESFVVDGVRLAVGADIGIGLFPDHGHDVDTVLTRAASALLAAKEDGHASVAVYGDGHRVRERNRLTVVAELRDALAGGHLRVHYQPQADFLTHQIRGVEALVRWEHPERGLLAAHEFISYAERGGLSQELRRFVVDEAAQQWRTWFELGFDLELAVNLSAVDMLDPALPEELQLAMARHDLPPWNLVLEITERSLIADERRARRIVEQLDEIGVRLAVDDFGTGFSSLASLRTFPIRQVKLDRSLLADVPGDESAEAIVGGSVEIAHGLGALVVAEGIETRQQWHFAHTMGCDIAQGHLIGRPAPADQLLELFDAPRLVPLSVA